MRSMVGGRGEPSSTVHGPRPTAHGRRAGFTLVELLTVVVIIGILAGLVTTAAIRAKLSARNRAVAAEIDDLVSALKMYEAEVKELPPCDFQTAAGQQAVLAHMRKRFPNYFPADWTAFKNEAGTLGINVDKITPATALVFWLGGVPKAAGLTQLAGFSANPSQPFQYGESRTKVYFPFDPQRLRTDPYGSGVLVYLPDNVNAPYVYFRPKFNTTTSQRDYTGLSYNGDTCWGANTGIAVPYCNSDASDWREPRSFQVITAGFDNNFGDKPATTKRRSVSGVDCSEFDYDNHTNFSQGTIQDEM